MDEGKALLRKRWESLQTAPAGLTRAALAQWKRDRGFALEKLLVDLARLENLDAASAYRSTGERIDGYFVVDNPEQSSDPKRDLARVAGADASSKIGALAAALPIDVARHRSKSFDEFVTGLEAFALSKVRRAS